MKFDIYRKMNILCDNFNLNRDKIKEQKRMKVNRFTK